MGQRDAERFFVPSRVAEDVVIVDAQNRYGELGYHEVRDSNVVGSFKSAWEEKARLSRLGELPKLPKITVLEKEGRTYLSLEFCPELLVVVSPLLIHRWANRMQIIGNEIENVLLTQDGQSLDLMSVVQRLRDHQTVFSFFGHGFYAPNEHQPRPMVVVPMKQSREGWGIKDFIYKFMHEKSHEVLADRHHGHIGWGLTDAQKEREVNAYAAQAIRQLTARYRDRAFISPQGFIKWAENQLETGYDDEKKVGAGLDYIASSKARKRYRGST